MSLESVKVAVEALVGPQLSASVSWFYWTVIAPTLLPFYWLWVASGVALACLYYYLGAARKEKPTPRSLVSYLLPAEIYLHPSARLDYRFYVLNQILVAQLRLGAWVGAAVGFLQVSHATKAAAVTLLGSSAPDQLLPGTLAVVLFTLCAFIATDFGRFAAHYLQHKIPLLWEFHKVHHAAEVLTPITGQRSHAIDLMLDLALRLVFTGILSGLFGYFFPGGLAELTILSFNAVAAFIYHPVALLSHSHVHLGYGPTLSRLLVSPLMHQVHHSKERRHWDKNFGFAFSLWDRVFGTLYVPHPDEEFRLGLPAGSGRFDTVWSLFVGPFARAARRVARLPPMVRPR